MQDEIYYSVNIFDCSRTMNPKFKQNIMQLYYFIHYLQGFIIFLDIWQLGKAYFVSA